MKTHQARSGCGTIINDNGSMMFGTDRVCRVVYIFRQICMKINKLTGLTVKNFKQYHKVESMQAKVQIKLEQFTQA